MVYCLIFAFLLKLPLYIFHLWLPRAHVEAPVAGSMILAGVLLKLGGYGLIRVFPIIYFFKFRYLFVSVGLFGGLLSGLVCLSQIDVKALVAYSSVGHMGIVLCGVLSFTRVGEVGGYVIIIGHGFCSSGLFCMVNFIYERFVSRRIFLIRGLMVIFPSMVFLMVCYMCSEYILST